MPYSCASLHAFSSSSAFRTSTTKGSPFSKSTVNESSATCRQLPVAESTMMPGMPASPSRPLAKNHGVTFLGTSNSCTFSPATNLSEPLPHLWGMTPWHGVTPICFPSSQTSAPGGFESSATVDDLPEIIDAHEASDKLTRINKAIRMFHLQRERYDRRCLGITDKVVCFVLGLDKSGAGKNLAQGDTVGVGASNEEWNRGVVVSVLDAVEVGMAGADGLGGLADAHASAVSVVGQGEADGGCRVVLHALKIGTPTSKFQGMISRVAVSGDVDISWDEWKKEGVFCCHIRRLDRYYGCSWRTTTTEGQTEMKNFHWRAYKAYKQVGKRADAATALRMFLDIKRGRKEDPSTKFDFDGAMAAWLQKARASA